MIFVKSDLKNIFKDPNEKPIRFGNRISVLSDSEEKGIE